MDISDSRIRFERVIHLMLVVVNAAVCLDLLPKTTDRPLTHRRLEGMTSEALRCWTEPLVRSEAMVSSCRDHGRSIPAHTSEVGNSP